MTNVTQDNSRKPRQLSLIVVGIVLNLGLGWLVATLKLPFYLDSIGTLLATALGGIGIGIATGVATVIIGSIYTPTLWAYAGTAVTIAVYTHICKRIGFLISAWRTAILGLVLGVVTAIVSAPVTAIVWRGVSLSGTDALTAFFAATGKSIMESVVLGGLSVDPLDKLVSSLVAFAVITRLPHDLINKQTEGKNTSG